MRELSLKLVGHQWMPRYLEMLERPRGRVKLCSVPPLQKIPWRQDRLPRLRGNPRATDDTNCLPDLAILTFVCRVLSVCRTCPGNLSQVVERHHPLIAIAIGNPTKVHHSLQYPGLRSISPAVNPLNGRPPVTSADQTLS